MQSLKVSLETVTPLFLGGANPRGEPELRSSSVRGALRFWLRALLGGAIGDSPDKLDALRQAESAVFGSTELGASPVVICLRHGSLSQVPFSRLASWNDKDKRYGMPGIAYMFFGARETGEEPGRSAINAGTVFNLNLSFRAGFGLSNKEAFARAYAALWLLTHLGGLGARSRRGGGSLQVREVIEPKGVPEDLPPLIVNATTPKNLQKEIGDGLSCLRRLVGTAVNIQSPSTFDVLHPSLCKIWVLDKAFHNWSEALEEIGKKMQQFRSRRHPDYQSIKAAMQREFSERPVHVQRAAFGLPIIFFYSSLYREYQELGDDKKTARRKATGTLKGQYHDRRASPLLIHVTKLANGKYVVVTTLFYAQLLPKDEELELELWRRSVRSTVPDWKLIEGFLDDLNTKVGPCLEVAGW